MAGYYTSYNNRRALGMRYSRPPELVLDEERLAQEYAQLPSKRALAEQQRQFNIAQQNQQDAQKQGGISSAIGTVGNIASMYYMGKNMGMWGGKAAPAVAPQATAPVTSGVAATGTPTVSVAPSAIDTGTIMPTATTGMSGAIPATTDLVAAESAMNAGVGAPVGMSSAELGVGAAGEGAATLGGAASAGAAAAPYAAAGYIAAKIGGGILENAFGKGESNVGSQFARTVQNPLQGIGKPWLDEIIKDEGTKKVVDTAMKVLNPIGAVFDWAGF